MKVLLYFLIVTLYSTISWGEQHSHEHGEAHSHDQMSQSEGHQGHQVHDDSGDPAASHTNMGTHHKSKGLIFYGDLAVSMSYQDSKSVGGAIFNPADGSFSGPPGQNLRHGHFNGNLAELNVEKNWGYSHFHLSFGAGATLADINRDTDRVFHVTNAYYQLDSPYGLSAQIGLFESPMGYESFNSMDNALFSRSYGFSLVPYFHAGAALKYNFKDMVKVQAAVVNGVTQDDLLDDGNENKHFIVTANIAPIAGLNLDLKYMGGKQQNIIPFGVGGAFIEGNQNTIEATLSYQINEAFGLAIDYTSLATRHSTIAAIELDSQSIAFYATGQFNKFGLGLRFESFKTDQGAPFGNGTPAFAFLAGANEVSISSITLAGSFMVDKNAKIVLEARHDSAGDDDAIWPDGDGASGATQSGAFSSTLGFMYRW